MMRLEPMRERLLSQAEIREDQTLRKVKEETNSCAVKDDGSCEVSREERVK